MSVTLNAEQGLFVIGNGSGYSCMGFQVLWEEAKELFRRLTRLMKNKGSFASELKEIVLQEDEIGTLKQYEQHRTLVRLYHHAEDTQTWFDSRTPKAVQVAVERARTSGDKIRVFHGDSATGRDWMEEFCVIGTVGRSRGSMKEPLLLTDDSGWGGSLMTSSIVRLVNLTEGEEMYRHPTYHTPKMRIIETGLADHPFTVNAEEEDGRVVRNSRFSTYEEAAHYVAFMQGISHDFQPEPCDRCA